MGPAPETPRRSPQALQNLAPSGLSAPHAPQRVMGRTITPALSLGSDEDGRAHRDVVQDPEEPVQDADATVADGVTRVGRIVRPVDREPRLPRPLGPRLDRLREAGEAEDVAAVRSRGAAGVDRRPDEVPPGWCRGRRLPDRPRAASPPPFPRGAVRASARRDRRPRAPSLRRDARRTPSPIPPDRWARSAAGSSARPHPRRSCRGRRGAGAAVPTGCRPRGVGTGAPYPAPRARRARRPVRRRPASLRARAS